MKVGFGFSLVQDLILSFQDYKESWSFFHKHSWEMAFKVVEVELGFVYDVLYTKAMVPRHLHRGY